MTRSPTWTRGRMAWPGAAQDTTTDVAGFWPQVRWICSGVPSAPAAPECWPAAAVAAWAGAAVAAAAAVARMPVPPAVSICRRDRERRLESGDSDFSAMWRASRLMVNARRPVLCQQVHVQGNDQAADQAGGQVRQAAVGQRAHHL